MFRFVDAAHLAQTFLTCRVDTIIDVGEVSALSQVITSFDGCCTFCADFLRSLTSIFAFADISSAEHKQHTKQDSREIRVLLQDRIMAH